MTEHCKHAQSDLKKIIDSLVKMSWENIFWVKTIHGFLNKFSVLALIQ